MSDLDNIYKIVNWLTSVISLEQKLQKIYTLYIIILDY